LQTVIDEGSEETKERLINNLKQSQLYNRDVGNIYTGSLYLSLLSLLENEENLSEGGRIGMFSYGSGAVGEFFTGKLVPGFKDYLQIQDHKQLFNERKEITVEEYEEIFEVALPTDGSEMNLNIEEDPAE